MLKPTIRLAAVPLAAPGLIAAAATVRTASVTCSGYSCHGHDPVVYNCTVSSTKTAGGSLLTV